MKYLIILSLLITGCAEEFKCINNEVYKETGGILIKQSWMNRCEEVK